jgi:hypothetical protein
VELDKVEILGLELDARGGRAELSVAYLRLNVMLEKGKDGSRIDFATLLTLLPRYGNRLFVEGPVGGGKSTLMRWAAIQAARWRLERARTTIRLPSHPISTLGSCSSAARPARREARLDGPAWPKDRQHRSRLLRKRKE